MQLVDETDPGVPLQTSSVVPSQQPVIGMPLQALVFRQLPDVEQVSPVEQVPHEPPQPSAPQVLPLQLGEQGVTQVPASPHTSFPRQYPGLHVPPQPSGPQVLPMQFGMQRAAGHALGCCPVGSAEPASP
jgi:hypothetical protein